MLRIDDWTKLLVAGSDNRLRHMLCACFVRAEDAKDGCSAESEFLLGVADSVLDEALIGLP